MIFRPSSILLPKYSTLKWCSGMLDKSELALGTKANRV